MFLRGLNKFGTARTRSSEKPLVIQTSSQTFLVVATLFSLFTSSCSPAYAADTFKLTGYDACKKCCGKTDGITASGKYAKPNQTIACNWLPFGTKVKIGNQIYTVQDRGAKSHFGSKTNHIKHIDIFFATHSEALRFGVQHQPVMIINSARTK